MGLADFVTVRRDGKVFRVWPDSGTVMARGGAAKKFSAAYVNAEERAWALAEATR